MDLRPEDETELRARLEVVLAFLRHPAQEPDGRPTESWERFRRLLGGAASEGLETWPGLGHTPILVLTSLAPGADRLLAEVALDAPSTAGGNASAGVKVIAALPFVAPVYRRASTFVRSDPPGDEDRSRQQGFDALRARLGPAGAFAVRLAGEVELDEQELERRQERELGTDDEARRARHRRYRAAGEYVAAHADLLIALWDAEGDQDTGPEACGTAAIVQARLHGFTNGLLPETTSFTWADAGPVLHVKVRRRQRAGAEPVPEEGCLALLHPPEPPVRERPEAVSPGVPALFSRALCRLVRRPVAAGDGHPNREGNQLLSRMAANLEAFSKTPLDEAKARADLGKLLPGAGTAGALAGALWPWVALRRRASDAGEPRDPRHSGVLRRVFRFALAAAVLLHLFAHWHPARGHGEVLQGGLGLAALVLAAIGLWQFWWCRSNGDAEMAHDWRALSEGLRVQIAWLTAGLGRSVVTGYLQRQRSELDWIPNAIRSLRVGTLRAGTPASLDPATRVHRWTRVRDVWVAGQCDYFRRTAAAETAEQHFWHGLGAMLALASVGVFLYLAGSLASGLPEPWTTSFILGPGGTAGVLLALLTLVVLVCRCTAERLGAPKRDRTPALERAVRALVVGVSSPGECAEAASGTPAHRRRGMLRAFGRHALAAVPVAVFAAASARWLSTLGTGLPGVNDLTIVAGGILLLGGGLAVAWSEKLLFSEHARQYAGMEGLFRRAEARLAELIRAGEAAANDPVRFDAVRAEVERLLEDLGHEALDENAEWLILHRARPLEPVMAG